MLRTLHKNCIIISENIYNNNSKLDSIYHLDAGVLRTILEQSEVGTLSDGARRRLAWLLFAAEHQASVEEVSDHFAISPTTFRRWLKRFDPTQPSSLEEQSRCPHHVRTSDIEKRVILLIEEYRHRNPTMGPRTIRKKLEEEHSVTLSTSTIWRVIDRNRFFFADTMSHRARREDREREDDKNENLGSGLGRIAATIVLALAVWSGLFGANMANAAESASFQLSAEFPAPSTTTTQTSTNFQLDGNLTWNDTSLEGTSTTISGTPSTTVVSQSTDSTSSAEESPASHRGGARAETVARRNAEIGGKDAGTGVPQSQDSALVTGDHPQETAEEASDTSKSSSIH